LDNYAFRMPNFLLLVETALIVLIN